MRIRRLGDRLALLLAAVLGIAGPAAVPTATAAADDAPVEIHGLKGEYYTQSAPGAFDFAELKATGFDPNLDFDNLEPRLDFTTGQSDDVSVRWTGRIVPERTGPHTFSIIGDNGFRLWIDGRLAIDHWVDDWDREQTAADKYNPQNEPDLIAPYTYLSTGQPWKTTDVVHAALMVRAPRG